MLLLQTWKLALDLGDFSFHLVDLQKKLIGKITGKGKRSIWRWFLSIAYSFRMFAVITLELW